MSAARAERLAQRVVEQGLDGLLVTNLVNVRYLTGFTGTNAVAYVGADHSDSFFLTDFRYVEQAEAQVGDAFPRARGKQELLEDVAARIGGRVGFDDAHLTVRAHRRLGEFLGDRGELVPAGGVVERLRAVKDAQELARIGHAAAIVDDVLEAEVVGRGLVGRTERAVALDLERAMRERGAEGPSFAPIVAAGAHGALPHAEPREAEIPAGVLVTVDLGAVFDGYCSDCTRTFATGAVDGLASDVYGLVLDAQRAALAAVRAGAGVREVDAVARERIGAAGHGDRFGHGLGHGVGLEIHEGPRLSPSGEGSLETGNVVTVEPGVYLPGELGVRIEDLVVVGDDGPEVLSGFTKELVTVA